MLLASTESIRSGCCPKIWALKFEIEDSGNGREMKYHTALVKFPWCSYSITYVDQVLRAQWVVVRFTPLYNIAITRWGL